MKEEIEVGKIVELIVIDGEPGYVVECQRTKRRTAVKESEIVGEQKLLFDQ